MYADRGPVVVLALIQEFVALLFVHNKHKPNTSTECLLDFKKHQGTLENTFQISKCTIKTKNARGMKPFSVTGLTEPTAFCHHRGNPICRLGFWFLCPLSRLIATKVKCTLHSPISNNGRLNSRKVRQYILQFQRRYAARKRLNPKYGNKNFLLFLNGNKRRKKVTQKHSGLQSLYCMEGHPLGQWVGSRSLLKRFEDSGV